MLFVPLVLVFASVGCGGSAGDSSLTGGTEGAVQFRDEEIVITKLNEPVPMPVLPGSRPSTETIASDHPEIVVVDDAGRLVALRNGDAIVRARGRVGTILRVRVRSPDKGLVLVPSQLTLRPGAVAGVQLRTADGYDIPWESAAWATSDPAIAVPTAGHVRATGARGNARIRARFGGKTQELEVVVEGIPAPMQITPAHAEINVGALVAFQASAVGANTRLTWRSRNTAVLASLGQGVFQALRRGRTEVCVEAFANEACTDVRVLR